MLTLKLISEETERVVKGLEKKHFPNAREAVEKVLEYDKKVTKYFGKKPQVFRNSCLSYSDEVGETVAEMGYKGMLAEGARHILGWKSAHYVYSCNRNPNLKVLLRDASLSYDISPYHVPSHSSPSRSLRDP